MKLIVIGLFLLGRHLVRWAEANPVVGWPVLVTLGIGFVSLIFYFVYKWITYLLCSNDPGRWTLKRNLYPIAIAAIFGLAIVLLLSR